MADYYSFDKIRDKGKLFNWIIGSRSCGKTFASKQYMVELALQGKRVIYLRRFASEIVGKKILTFFDKIQAKGYYVDQELSCDGNHFYLGDFDFGDILSLSTSLNVRSVDFNNIGAIFFEEFVLKEDMHHRYLINEVETFLELYSTIARDNDIPVYFIGNKIVEYNPYFVFFDLVPPVGVGIKTYGDHAIEYIGETKSLQDVKNTRFAKLIDGTSYGDYNLNNVALSNNDTFIRQMPKGCTILCNFVVNNDIYGCWVQPNDKQLYLSQSYNKSALTVLIAGKATVKKYKTVKYFKTQPQWQYYYNRLIRNEIFYTNQKLLEIGYNIINTLCKGGV